MLSVILPAYMEPLLQKTVTSLLENAEGEVEIIPVLDGWDTPLYADHRVKSWKLTKNEGMRGAINAGIELSRGEWIMKLDAHCLVGPGYDKLMVENCAEDWVMVPERWSLDEVNWQRNLVRPIRRSHYLSFPIETKYGYQMSPVTSHYWDRRMANGDLLDSMSFQGSCWMVHKKYFNRYVGGVLDNRGYGPFYCDFLEVGLGYWLNGGQVKINTKTWYAHLSKRAHHYASGNYSTAGKKRAEVMNGNTWAAKRWIEDPRFPSFLKKFWPVPTWMDNWREIWDSYDL